MSSTMVIMTGGFLNQWRQLRLDLLAKESDLKVVQNEILVLDKLIEQTEKTLEMVDKFPSLMEIDSSKDSQKSLSGVTSIPKDDEDEKSPEHK